MQPVSSPPNWTPGVVVVVVEVEVVAVVVAIVVVVVATVVAVVAIVVVVLGTAVGAVAGALHDVGGVAAGVRGPGVARLRELGDVVAAHRARRETVRLTRGGARRQERLVARSERWRERTGGGRRRPGRQDEEVPAARVSARGLDLCTAVNDERLSHRERVVRRLVAHRVNDARR